MPARENGHEEPVIRDKRKIDPETGQVRETAAADQAAGQPFAEAPAAPSPTASWPPSSPSGPPTCSDFRPNT